MNYFIVALYLFTSFVLLRFIVSFLIKRKCPICSVNSRGIIYEFEENDLIDSGLIKSKDLSLLRSLENMKTHSIKVCLDCKYAINEELKKVNKKVIPDLVKRYFRAESLDNLVSFEIKKSEFAPVMLLLFSCLLYIGVSIVEDYNSLFTIIGAEGLAIYSFTWIVYRQVSWEGYIGKKGVIMWQNYGKYKLFYKEYDWMRVKVCNVKDKVVKLYFNEFSLFSCLFFLEFAVPSSVVEKKHFMDSLEKNKVPKKK